MRAEVESGEALWRALLEHARREAQGRAWMQAVPDAPDVAGAPDDRPLLAGVRFVVDAQALERWTMRLLRAAGVMPADGLDHVRWLAAAVNEDALELDAVAEGAGLGGPLVRGLAPILALPLLQACGRAWGPRAPAGWDRGWCPLCAAWPALAEERGLDAGRHLRCLRCGADWPTLVLRCPYCETTGPERLGALVPEAPGDGRTRRIETCAVCRGYLKVTTRLTAAHPLEVAFLDLETIELDAAALERGYRRPLAPAAPLGAHVSARRGWLVWPGR
jgi:FdhE protein